MRIHFMLLGIALGVCQLLFSQTDVSYSVENYSIVKRNTRAPKDVSFDWRLTLQNIEAPFQHNQTYQYFLQDLKKEIELKYPRKDNLVNNNEVLFSNPVAEAYQTDSLEGNQYSGGVPNDNTMAISNSGILISAINTNVFFYDTNTDSLLKTISLNAFSDTLTYVSTHQYDPKLIYDYNTDRFILVFLAGGSSDTLTYIIVAFSTTSNPLDDWNFYALSGNPLNDNSWTDFPAISLSNNELFITANLLFYGTSWQTSFKQSVIWQVNKSDGYAGANLTTKLYYNIKYDNINLRNLHPVVGGNQFYGPEMYFLSNRNFSIQCDSFFLVKTSGLISSNPTLSVKYLKSNHMYGAPPRAKQPGNKWLETNDARVLGAFYQNNQIQLVGNTIDTVGGKAKIYHGIINYPDQASTLRFNLLTDTLLEFGYPNISWFGTYPSSNRSIISCNFSAGTVNPGFGAFTYDQGGSYFNPVDKYSSYKKLKNGETYMAILLGGNQRWGDYSGSQIRYNQNGKIWICGTFGKLVGSSRRYGTWICELSNIPTEVQPTEVEKTSMLVFPNPVNTDMVSVEFAIQKSKKISIDVFDMQGRLIRKMYVGNAKAGKNLLSFTTDYLTNGIYMIKISAEGEEIGVKKINVIH